MVSLGAPDVIVNLNDSEVGVFGEIDDFATIQRGKLELFTQESVFQYVMALQTRIADLEKINAVLMGDDEDKPRYTTKRLKQEIARATANLEDQLAAAKKERDHFRDDAKSERIVKGALLEGARAEVAKLRESLRNLVAACDGEIEEVFAGEIGDELRNSRQALAGDRQTDG